MLKWLMLASLFLLGACDTQNGMVAMAQSAGQDTNAPSIGPASPVAMASAWGKTLNRDGTAPSQGFRAFYFDRRAPGEAVAQDTVSTIAVKYAWNEFHNIDSPNFGGYWVGRLNFDAPTTQEISVSLSWSKARIIINGDTVFEGGQSGTFSYDFPAGESLVEVEFANGWHTTEFKVTFQDTASLNHVDTNGLAAMLRGSKYRNRTINYVGIYESGAPDTSIAVQIPAAQNSPVLWLSSYEAVEWRVKTADDIPLVVVTSYAPGSRVHGVPPERVVYLDDRNAVPRVSSSDRRCSCTGGHFHCEGEAGIREVATRLRELTGLDLTGYALGYSPTTLSVMPWNDQAARVADERRQAEDDARRQCSGPTLPAAPSPRVSERPDNWKYGDPVTTQP